MEPWHVLAFKEFISWFGGWWFWPLVAAFTFALVFGVSKNQNDKEEE